MYTTPFQFFNYWQKGVINDRINDWAKDLTRRYKKVEAVQSLDLAVRRGEIFGIVGPAGVGKTTTIQNCYWVF